MQPWWRYHRECSLFLSVLLGISCTGTERDSSTRPDTLASAATASQTPVASSVSWQVRPLDAAPPRFRPGGWSDETVLWGLLGSRVTRLDTQTGALRTTPHMGWSIHAARGVVSWRNESGTWLLRDGGEATRLAGARADSASGFDGPPSILWSGDGSRALLAWQGEWDSRYDLLARDGSRRRLQIAIPGYFGNGAVLWLDSTRVLFHTTANGPVGGEPTYRESGWRTDLAVLDLRNGAYTRVTSVPDSIYLRVAGWYLGDVLVTERDTREVRGHWLYDPRTWQRRPMTLPKGRAYASSGGAVVVFLDDRGDSTNAVLITAADTVNLGQVARDSEPVFSPSGRRGGIRAGKGVIVFERR